MIEIVSGMPALKIGEESSWVGGWELDSQHPGRDSNRWTLDMWTSYNSYDADIWCYFLTKLHTIYKLSTNFILVGCILLRYLYKLYKHTTQKLYICDPQTQLNNFFTLPKISLRENHYFRKGKFYMYFIWILYAFM
jgi:hypothetical protein